MGLCGLARLLFFGSVLNMKETETHTQTCTYRLVLLATLTFSGKASLFQFRNEEMGTFEALPPIHQRGYWNTTCTHTPIWYPLSFILSHLEEKAASILAPTLWRCRPLKSYLANSKNNTALQCTWFRFYRRLQLGHSVEWKKTFSASYHYFCVLYQRWEFCRVD